MKKLYPILIISLLFLLLGCSQNVYKFNDIIKMDNGLWTLKFSKDEKPITGKVYRFFGEKSDIKKVYYGSLLNGKIEGRWTTWWDNGHKKFVGNYKDGELDGLSTQWYDNGKKEVEGIFKDGELDGLSTLWFENGQKKYEGTYKDGELVEVIGVWNEDGTRIE